MIFVADLVREMPVYMQIRMMSISSYPGTSTESKGAVVREGLSHLPQSLEGRHVLLIDDIFDTGKTLQLAVETLKERNPASVRTCVLLFKERPDNEHLSVDYHCFRIPDEFVVGYGLDFNDYYRNLPEIVTLKKQVIENAKAT
jgi:hypoxanthine phosphoribosyltransferase